MKDRNWCTLIGFLIGLFVFMLNSNAQSTKNLRMGSRIVDSFSFKIDTFSIVPNTFSLQEVSAEQFSINYTTSELTLLDSSLLGKTIHYTYQVFSLDLSKKIAHKSPEMILPRFVSDPTAASLFQVSSPTEPFFDSSLQGTGSLARSVSIGNNQNFVLDAHLNLQLTGKLSPDVEILANITDENLPVQPEGNTRVLKDFNKIFIQLKYKNLLKVTAGDIEHINPDDAYFMRVNRQFLGLRLEASYPLGESDKMSNMVGGGISKGKFVRNTLSPQLGVQGPYRLYGAQNETSIIIIAGSERVYLNGELLKRGESNDYIIDYNTGEITFSTKHLIAPENRIVVEFEYSDRYYSRYNLFTHHEFTHEKNTKLKLNVRFFHEQDLKNRSLNPELSEKQMLFLSQIGDDKNAALFSTAIPTNDFTSGEVLYHQRDTIIGSRVYPSIYVYAGASRDSVYRVNFTYVGSNKGHYVLAQSAANGKVYEWVAPLNDELQGDYEPVVQLNMPQMTEMLSVGAAFEVNEKLKLQTEWAMSYFDQNLFSKKDDGDNLGMAYQLHLVYHTKLYPKKVDNQWKYRLQLDYEYLHKNFHYLESFRNVEFARDYNLSEEQNGGVGEQLLKFTTGVAHPQKGSTLYSLNWLTHFSQLQAFRNEINSSHRFGTWTWNSHSSYLFSYDNIQKTNYLHTKNDINKSWNRVVLGFKEELDYNLFKKADSDSLRANSYAFNEASIYLKNGDSTKVNYLFAVKNRVDNHLYHNILSTNTITNEAQFSVEITHWKHHRLTAMATYRNDNVRDSMRQFRPEHNFIGSVDYSANFLKGAIALNVYYEAGSGLEQKKSYTFLKVAAGQGTHVWNDYNGNGIEELDEFEVANFQNEADYIKVWLTTQEYITTSNCGTTQSLLLRPANLWQNKTGFLRFLSFWSNHTVVRTYQKNTLHNNIRAFNPFQFNLEDSVLVNQTMNLKNNLSFSLPKQYFSVEYLYMKNQVKNLLYYGFESSHLDAHQLTFRSVPTSILVLQTIYNRSMKKNASQYFGSRSYQILTHQLQEIITLRFQNNITVAIDFLMGYHKNIVGSEKSNQYNLSFDFDYRIKEKGTVALKLQYISILYNAKEDNALAYEMLQGLTKGNNFLWNLAYQTKLFEYLQLNLQYEGRVTNDKRVIHTGFLQLKAFF